MIKLFRNIRKKILAEGKTTNYLKYAIGEIVLVMIGILLALQVNNWKEARKDRLNEVKYIKNLKLDLEADLVNLDTMMIDRQKKISSGEILLTLPPPTTLKQLNVFDSLFGNVYKWTSFTPRTNTLDELISSGSLNSIKNDSIKFYLLAIRDKNEKIVINREHMRREYDNYLYDRTWPILEIRPLWDIKKTTAQRKNVVLEITEEEQSQIASQVAIYLKDKIIHNGLKLAIMNNFSILKKYELLKVDIEKLITFINKDINDNQ